MPGNGTITGLNVLRIINEPTAASIACSLNKKGESQIISVVVPSVFPSRSTTVSLMSWQLPLVVNPTTVMDHLIKGYKKTGTDVTKNLRAIWKLKREVEKAKCSLSSQQSVRTEIESFEDGTAFRKPSHAPSSRNSTRISATP